MIFKKGLKLFGISVVANVMCFILIISFSVISTALFTEKIGYTMYGATAEGEELKELYTYYFEDGDDTQKEKYEQKGYSLTEITLRSQVSKTNKVVWSLVSQIFCLVMMISFIYNQLWQLGSKDSNLVKFKSLKEDKLKGLKIGLIASAPSFIFFVFSVISKKVNIALFAFLNAYLYDFISLIANGAKTFDALSIWQILLIFVILLIFPAAAYGSYLLGYKQFSISEKLVYKKNKEV